MRLSDRFKSLPAIKARQQIPPHKRRSQWQRTALGLGVAVVAVLLRWKLEMPWPAVYVLGFSGGFIASKDLMLTLVKVIPEAIGAVAGAVAGRKPDANHE